LFSAKFAFSRFVHIFAWLHLYPYPFMSIVWKTFIYPVSLRIKSRYIGIMWFIDWDIILYAEIKEQLLCNYRLFHNIYVFLVCKKQKNHYKNKSAKCTTPYIFADSIQDAWVGLSRFNWKAVRQQIKEEKYSYQITTSDLWIAIFRLWWTWSAVSPTSYSIFNIRSFQTHWNIWNRRSSPHTITATLNVQWN